MDPASDKKGEIVLRTKFNQGGLVRADNFSLTPEQMIEDKDWQREVEMKEGPHCLIRPELDIPF